MGFKKDDSGSLPKSSFTVQLVFFPVSTLQGTVHRCEVFFLVDNRYLFLSAPMLGGQYPAHRQNISRLTEANAAFLFI